MANYSCSGQTTALALLISEPHGRAGVGTRPILPPSWGAGADTPFSPPHSVPRPPGRAAGGAGAAACPALLMTTAPAANSNAAFEILTLDKYLKNRRLKTHVNLQHKYFKGADFPRACLAPT